MSKAWEIEKEVLGMLSSVFWLEVGVGLVHVGGGGWKGGWTLGVGDSGKGLRALYCSLWTSKT